MEIVLKRARLEEADKLYVMQKNAFADDLVRYRDYAYSPAMETLERVQYKIIHSLYFGIWADGVLVGAIDVTHHGNHHYSITRIYVDVSRQGEGIGKEAMGLIERKFPDAHIWSLNTPWLNTWNHRFYESLGYERIGEHRVTELLVLYDYQKVMRHIRKG